MALVSLERVKEHLRVFHTDEDTQIELYRDAAEVVMKEYLDREVVEAGQSPTTDDGIEVTAAIIAAILLLCSDLYEQREPDQKLHGDAVLPRVVRSLLAPYRVWRTSEVTRCM